jgi:hypothetical protein
MKKIVLLASLLPLAALTGIMACSSDGGTGGTPSVACTDCLSDTVTWGPNGGLVSSTEESTLSSCRQYQHSSTPAVPATDPPASPTVCTVADIGGCDAAAPAIHDIEEALAHPDVVAALAGNVPVYGEDNRPCDGSVTSITFGGHTLLVGGECGTGDNCFADQACVPVPAGVRALVDLLADIDAKEKPLATCATGL